MSAGQNIGDREREILTAIVETFISTGEPVGSRMLSRGSREGLSPATIRNVMADLVDAGYLEQPHTSAGRVPSSWKAENLDADQGLRHGKPQLQNLSENRENVRLNPKAIHMH